MDILLLNSGLAFATALMLAVLDWLAVHHERKLAQYIFKPATLLAVLVAAWLTTRGPHDVWMARFFLLGLVCSLIGDVFLMLPDEHFFVPGLVFFLLAHVCYIVGLNPVLPPLLVVFPLVVVSVLGALLFRSLVSSLRRRGQQALLGPVVFYGLALSVMLVSAWATLFRPSPPWTPLRRGFVIVGASLFSASDSMLAWNKFVGPLPLGSLLVMVTYHLAQISLAVSIALI